MSEPIYTQPQIEEAWTDYNTEQILRVLKDGKWTAYDETGNPDLRAYLQDGATRAELVNLKTVMSFPKYLKKHYD